MEPFSERRGTPGAGRMQVLMLLVAMTTAGRGFVDTEEFISDLDMPIPTAHVTGVLGKKASLPCDTQPLSADDKVAMVLWFKETDWEPLYSYDVRGRTVYQPKLWSSPTGFGTRAYFRATASPATLLVDSVSTVDSGVYRCRVDFKNSPTRNLRINFTVITPPNRPTIMDARTRDLTRLLEPYDEGDTLELLCEVYGGDPRPSVIWYLENTIIDDSYERRDDGVTTNSLSFPRVGRQHLNSRIICQASNTNLAPPLTKLLILDINLRPLSVQILKKRGPLSADRTYEVECISTGSRPSAQITWWKASKPLKKNIRNFSDANSTTSMVQLVPEAQDHESELTCRTENPRLAASTLEDTWKLDVFYVPVVSLKLGSNLSPSHIREGDDVYFECSARANPPPTKFTWYKQSREITHNSSAGVILSDQSLVLQSVQRSASGDYSCAAQNREGSASSNAVALQVRYPPICISSEDGQVFGALKKETVKLKCEVDSNPPPDNFLWAFNSSGEYRELETSLYKSSSSMSILLYTPSREEEFGIISCIALNTAGRQSEPCTFTLVAAGVPTSLHNCSVVNQSTTALQVECEEGFDGGLLQDFHMEVLELPSMIMQANITSNRSTFVATGLPPRARGSYLLNLYAANAKGRGEVLTLYTVISPDRYTDSISPLSLSPMLVSVLATGALLSAAVCAVLAAAYRRHTATADKRPSNNALYAEDSTESFPKRDNLNTYTASPKIDYNSQFELKLDPDEDPDIIPVNYAKKMEEARCVAESDSLRIYDRGFTHIANNYNISVVNRGVTARSTDIAASRLPNDVRESCI
ncbi:unnamed protein product [Leptosia nina]|uniref:Ig-like domain-containing protein n=1 Tax=Leptosia nina TaxID=320188 RepID=A0AAV1JUZ2_9NEOP